ncbi:uncharacterized protein LOC111251529 [Varroa destructor]|uniref:Uncharacterized protein n=1 Tax=Varroa destructor TaxID=109461 RepID=A0A7M7KP86_VARDE|nr:uncharacterized protein LOC111251529 [Varroa destructor]
MTREKRKIGRDAKAVPRENSVQALAEEMEKKIAEEFRKLIAKQHCKENRVSLKEILKLPDVKAAPAKNGKPKQSNLASSESVNGASAQNGATSPGKNASKVASDVQPSAENNGDDESFGVAGALTTSPMEMPRFDYPEDMRNRSRNSLGVLLMQMLANADGAIMSHQRNRGLRFRHVPLNFDRSSNGVPVVTRPSDHARISIGRPSSQSLADLAELPFLPLLRHSAHLRERNASRQQRLQRQLLQEQPASQSASQPQQQLQQQQLQQQQQGRSQPIDGTALATVVCDHNRGPPWRGRFSVLAEESDATNTDDSDTLSDDYSALLNRDNEFVIIMETDDRDFLPLQSPDDISGFRGPQMMAHDVGWPLPVLSSEARILRRRRGRRAGLRLSERSTGSNRSTDNMPLPIVNRHQTADSAETRSSGNANREQLHVASASPSMESAANHLANRPDHAIACIRQLLDQVIRISQEGSSASTSEQTLPRNESMAGLRRSTILPRESTGRRRSTPRRNRGSAEPVPPPGYPTARVFLRRPVRMSRAGRARRSRNQRARAVGTLRRSLENVEGRHPLLPPSPRPRARSTQGEQTGVRQPDDLPPEQTQQAEQSQEEQEQQRQQQRQQQLPDQKRNGPSNAAPPRVSRNGKARRF